MKRGEEAQAGPGQGRGEPPLGQDGEIRPGTLKLTFPATMMEMLSRLGEGLHPGLSPRWRSWLVRAQSGLLLLSCWATIVSFGRPGLALLTHAVQVGAYREVVGLGLEVTGQAGLTGWTWALFSLAQLFWPDPALSAVLPCTEAARQAVCACLYLCLLLWFLATTPSPATCLPRYSLLAWAHLATLYTALPAHLAVLTLARGPVWFIFSMTIITLNDIAAYMCGFFCGRTPLTALSPHKTVEGYVGGGAVTVVLGPALAGWLQQFPALTDTVLASQFYSGPSSPFVLHCAAISLFAATLGPTAGLLCSGFKRGCNRKNFGSLIPGHGGVMDRCDCMFLMAVFTFFYLENVVY